MISPDKCKNPDECENSEECNDDTCKELEEDFISRLYYMVFSLWPLFRRFSRQSERNNKEAERKI